MVGEERRRLEQLAGLSAAEAKAELIRRMEEEAQADAANRLREIRESAKRNADREAKKIVALAVQRIAADHTAEITVSAVALPKDEMKGRIIGREGRNIRAFELATGVDVIIDDTPDSVVVSCFDPVRREVARLALEKLVADGRIHPGPHRGSRREVAQGSRRRDHRDRRAGRVRSERARPAPGADQARGPHEVAHELRPEHPPALEGSRLARRRSWPRSSASTPRMARRGALLHDIGKVLTHEHEGTHVQLGVEVATKYGENPLVVNVHRRAPRRRAARERSQRARAGGGRDQRFAARRAARGVRDVREAARGAREDRVELYAASTACSRSRRAARSA